MSNYFRLAAITGLAIVGGVLFEGNAEAQFSIAWYTVDGGGGRSTAANFELVGTIGQPDAGATMSFGEFSLRGGFWSLSADPFILGDVNGDGQVDLLDVAPFVNAITSGTFIPEADINMDGQVSLLDVAPFVDLLTGG